MRDNTRSCYEAPREKKVPEGKTGTNQRRSAAFTIADRSVHNRRNAHLAEFLAEGQEAGPANAGCARPAVRTITAPDPALPIRQPAGGAKRHWVRHPRMELRMGPFRRVPLDSCPIAPSPDRDRGPCMVCEGPRRPWIILGSRTVPTMPHHVTHVGARPSASTPGLARPAGAYEQAGGHMNHRFLLGFFVVFASLPAWADLGPGVSKGNLSVPDAYLSDWTQAGVTGGIPDTSDAAKWAVIDTDTTDIGGCARFTSAEKTDTRDDYSKINCYITYAATQAGAGGRQGTVVKLGSGTFYVDDTTNGVNRILIKSNVVLRGSGSDGTTTITGKIGGTGNGGYQGLVIFDGYGTTTTQAVSTNPIPAGTTQVTVASGTSFSVGDWVYLEEGNDPALIDNPLSGWGSGDTAIRHYAKVSGKSINLITLDRPTAVAFNPTYSPRLVKIANPVKNAGLEDLKVMGRDVGTNYTSYTSIVTLDRTFDSWIQRVWMYQGLHLILTINESSRNTILSNKLEKSLWSVYSNDKNHDCYQISYAKGSSFNLIANNIQLDTYMPYVSFMGVHRNVYAYNYVMKGANNTLDALGVFSHGWYPYENLVEGNDVDVQFTHDDWWGQQGPRNVFYRNRLRDGTQETNWPRSFFRGETRWDRNASVGKSAQSWYWANNSAWAWFVTPFCSYPGCINYFTETYNSIAEKNTYRDPTIASNRGFVGCSSPNGTGGNNQVGTGNSCIDVVASSSPPAAWATFNFPASLWTSAKPAWWCNETPWPAIGANIDTFGGGLNKLPAQRLHEGLPCTLSGSSGLGVPGRPVLVP